MKNKSFVILSFIFAVAALGAGFWYATAKQRQKAAPVSSTEPQYPIEEEKTQEAAVPNAVPRENAPVAVAKMPRAPLFNAGETLEARLARFFNPEKFSSLIVSGDLAHKFVVFIENVSERRPSGVFSLFAPLSEEFEITSSDDDIIMNPKNFARYEPYLELLNSVDNATLVAIYKHYYKTFQADYDELGMGGYFNDHLVAAMDVVLSTPEAPANAVLKGIGPYKFANADFEALPASQKVMIRMGPENAKVLKSKVRQLRPLVARRRR